ncbi:hypothetical protein [Streptomyces sp. NPDC000410]|uniref:hypothetical protein n=1 Tax=Streptomyces sp. NPDC000410 TaxID=3154254 RepID=UPI003317D683
MNRHSRPTLSLLAPVLASSLVLAPAVAAPGQAAEGAAPVAPAAPACELVASPYGTPGAEPTYDLMLSGFAGGQQVRINGPERSTITLGEEGTLKIQSVPYGSYRVSYEDERTGKNKRVTCDQPSRKKPGDGQQSVKVTRVEVFVLSPTVVDCTKPQQVEFDGKITAEGRGKVAYHWTQQSDSTPVSPGTVEFSGTTKSHSILRVVKLPANPLETRVSTALHAQGMSSPVTEVRLTCAKP